MPQRKIEDIRTVNITYDISLGDYKQEITHKINELIDKGYELFSSSYSGIGTQIVLIKYKD